jgi:hypothetical protein
VKATHAFWSNQFDTRKQQQEKENRKVEKIQDYEQNICFWHVHGFTQEKVQ